MSEIIKSNYYSEETEKNWDKLKNIIKINLKQCYDLKVEYIHKQLKDAHNIVEAREEVFAFILTCMEEMEEDLEGRK